VLDSDDEPLAGPLSKRTRATFPRQGKSVDALEISNMECHMTWTQLEAVCQGWEAMNMELCLVGAQLPQLKGICWGIEYLSRMAWKRYAVNHGISASG